MEKLRPAVGMKIKTPTTSGRLEENTTGTGHQFLVAGRRCDVYLLDEKVRWAPEGAYVKAQVVFSDAPGHFDIQNGWLFING